MHGVGGGRDEGEEIGDALLGGEGGVQGGEMEGERALGGDGLAAIEGVVGDGGEEAEVGEHLDESGLVDGAGGEVLHGGVGGGFGEPVLHFKVGGDVGVGRVVGVDEAGEELVVGGFDARGVVEEGEGLEGEVAGLVDQATGLEVGLEVVGLELAAGGPGLGDELTAAEVVDVQELIPVTAGVEAELLTDDAGRVGLVHDALEDDHDGVLLAEGVEGSLVDGFGHVVADDQVVHLGVELVVDVEDHLAEEPVVGGVKGSVDEVGVGVGLDGQGEEVLGIGVDVEVGRASSTPARRVNNSSGISSLRGV